MSKGYFETVINDHLNSPVNRPLNDDVNDQVNGVVRACFEDVVKGVVSVVFGNGITDVVKAGITDVIEDGIIGGIIDGITDGIIGSVDGVTEVVVEDHINIRVDVCFNDYPEFLNNDVSDSVPDDYPDDYPEFVDKAGTNTGFRELYTDRSDSLGSKKKVKSYKQRLKHDSKSFPKFPLRISQKLFQCLQRNAVL